MSGHDVGDVAIRITADGAGFDNDVAQKATKGAEKGGTSFSHKFGTALKVGGKIAGAGLAGILGYSLAAGFKRLSTIDDAKKKLAGLGHSATEIKGIMGSALKSVKGTAFGLGDAATVAAGAVAAGIKPGKDLTATLKLTADAASIAGVSMGDMGQIFNKVATSNKVQGDTINQLSDKGIPIVALLGKTLHKSASEVVKLASKGKINFAQFSAAMKAGVGGAALSSGKTFKGAFANLKASLGRIGAGFLSGIFPLLAPSISKLTNAMAPLEDAAAGVGKKLGKLVSGALAKLPLMIDNAKSRWREFKEGFSVGDLGPGASTFQKLGASAKIFMAAMREAKSQVGIFFTEWKTVAKDADPGGGPSFMDRVASDAGKLAVVLAGALAKAAKKLPPLLANLNGRWKEFLQGFRLGSLGDGASKFQKFGASVKSLLDTLKGSGGPGSAGILNQLPGILKSLHKLSPVAAAGIKLFGKALKLVANHAGLVAKMLPVIVGLGLAVKGANSAFGPKSTIGYSLRTAALIANATSNLANMAATRAASAATELQTIATEENTTASSLSRLARLRATAASVAGAIKTGIMTAATTVATGAQWLFNAALDANPITLVIIALVLLGAAFVVLWKKSQKFRAIVTGVWNGIKDVSSAVFGWFSGWLWPHFKAFFSWITSGFSAVGAKISGGWSKIKGYFSSAWHWMSGTFRSSWNGLKGIIMSPVNLARSAISGGWSKIKGYFSAAWHWMSGTFRSSWNGLKGIIMSPVNLVHGLLSREVRGWKKIFSGAKTDIKKIWDGMESIIKKPISWGVHHVLLPLANGINDLIPGSGPIKTGWMNGMDRGGTVAGQRHPYGDKVHAMLAPGEEIITNRHGEADRYRSMRDTGQIPHFADGGPVNNRGSSSPGLAWSGIEKYRPSWRGKLVEAMRSLQHRGWSILEMEPFSRVHSVHSAHSLHYLPSRAAGDAADISNPGMHGADSVARQLMAAGFGVKWKAPGHFDHIHVDTSLLNEDGSGFHPIKGGGGGGGGLLGSIFGGLKGKIKGLLGSATKRFGGSWPIKMLTSPLAGGLSKLWGWAGKLFSKLNPVNLAEDLWHGLGGGGSPKVHDTIRTLASLRGWNKGNEWAALQNIISSESSWDAHAKNKSSGAYGLFQALPASKYATYGSDWRDSATTQGKWGLNYISQRYGDPERAWAFHLKHNWYGDGGRVTPTSFDSGGMLPPGLSLVHNGTGRPEPVGHDLKGGDTYINVSMNVSIDDLNKMSQMGDFLRLLDTASVRQRMTARSGTTAS